MKRSCTVILLVLSSAAVVDGETVFFVGNSYTGWNDGIPHHLELFCESASPGSGVEIGSIVVGGASLKNHWENPAVIEAITSGYWDTVVMQEQSTMSVENPLQMYTYADSLGDLIDSVGSRPVFYMTWARRNDPEMLFHLESAYLYAAGLSTAGVVPVGPAFRRCILLNPGIELYAGDGSHPSDHGTYLAVCLFYAFLWQESPIGVEYVSSPSITPEEQLAIQEVAWEIWLIQGQAR